MTTSDYDRIKVAIAGLQTVSSDLSRLHRFWKKWMGQLMALMEKGVGLEELEAARRDGADEVTIGHHTVTKRLVEAKEALGGIGKALEIVTGDPAAAQWELVAVERLQGVAEEFATHSTGDIKDLPPGSGGERIAVVHVGPEISSTTQLGKTWILFDEFAQRVERERLLDGLVDELMALLPE